MLSEGAINALSQVVDSDEEEGDTLYLSLGASTIVDKVIGGMLVVDLHC